MVLCDVRNRGGGGGEGGGGGGRGGGQKVPVANGREQRGGRMVGGVSQNPLSTAVPADCDKYGGVVNLRNSGNAMCVFARARAPLSVCVCVCVCVCVSVSVSVFVCVFVFVNIVRP